MPRSLLPHIPAAGLEAILKQLESCDHASLRLVSRSMSEQTTQLIPSIILKLSSSSRPEQLQQWCQATQQFQHVTRIHVRIAGHIPVEVFEQAMKLLSQCIPKITSLHLLAVDVCSSLLSSEMLQSSAAACACIQTLQPLQHLMHSLKVLVIQGVVIPALFNSLEQLAAAVTPEKQWKLCKLAQNVGWYLPGNWFLEPGLFPALQHLPAVFPDLKHLELQLPHPPTEFVMNEDLRIAYEVAMAAAVVNAVLQLESLETLLISQLSEFWKQEVTFTLPTADAVSAAATDVRSHFNTALEAGDITTVDGALEVFDTLDGYGRYLMQCHPALRSLIISTINPQAIMTWQLEQQTGSNTDCDGSVVTNCSTDCASQIHDLEVQADLRSPATYLADFTPVSNDDSISNGETVFDACERHLCDVYSHQATVILLSHINSIRLTLTLQQVSSLAELLGDLKSLKDLEITVPPGEQAGKCSATAAIAAAAAVQTLECFTLRVMKTRSSAGALYVADDLLLPLTAAAGGPGRNLRKLVLVGSFQPPPAAATTAAICTTRWYDTLRQLTAVHHLQIINADKEQLLDVPAESLPPGLRILMTCRLNITSAAASTRSYVDQHSRCAGLAVPTLGLADGSSETAADVCMCRQEITTASGGANLQGLFLNNSQLSSPSILASDMLRLLSINNSSWSGGWEAAAAAWPNVREVAWQWHNDFGSSRFSITDNIKLSMSCLPVSGRCHSMLDTLTFIDDMRQLPRDTEKSVHEALKCICLGFKQLSRLTVMDLPWLSVDILQPLVHHLKQLHHIKFYIAPEDYRLLHYIKQYHIRASGLSSRSSIGQVEEHGHDDNLPVRQWLCEQFPWVTVCCNVLTMKN